jgi:uncharacterized membrane protein YkvA (DUF1232 family)
MKKQWQSWFRREKKKAARLLSDPVAVVRAAHDAADKAHGVRDTRGPLGRLWDDLQTAIRLVRAWGGRDYRGVGRGTIVLVLGALLYFVTPVDAIFDGIPVIGLLDDAAVLTWVLRQSKAELEAFRAWESERQAQPAAADANAA